VYRVTIDLSDPTLSIKTAFRKIYNSTKILFNLSSDEKVEFGYIDNSATRPYYRRLASGVSTYNRSVIIADGYHNITILVRDPAGNTDSENVAFIVDSRNPIIVSTTPTSRFTNGRFSARRLSCGCGIMRLSRSRNTPALPQALAHQQIARAFQLWYRT
jgi:hypothetical protein